MPRHRISEEEQSQSVTVRLPGSLVEALLEQAMREDRSFSGEVRRALKQYLAREGESRS